MERAESPLEKPARLTRRQVLKGAAIGGVGFIAGAVAKGTLGSGSPDRVLTLESKPTKIYTNGEVIETPEHSVQIDKWSLIFEPSRSGRPREYKEFGYSYSLFIPKDDRNILSDEGNSGGYGYRKQKKNILELRVHPISDNQTYFFRLFERANKGEQLKNSDSQIVYLNYMARQGDRVAQVRTYPISIQFYTYQHPPKFSEDYVGRHRVVYSEVPLDGRILREIHEHGWLFAPFLKNGDAVPIYINESNDPEKRGGTFSYDDHRVDLSSIIFTDPLFENEGLAKLDHELSHGIMDSVISDRNQEDNMAIFGAYKKLVGGAGFKVPPPISILTGIPEDLLKYFEIFDEGSYVTISEEGSDYGHPWQNYHELFASGLTVLRYFPDQFIERFHRLPSTQKKLVKEAFEAMITVLNPKHRYFPRILLQYDRLRASTSF